MDCIALRHTRLCNAFGKAGVNALRVTGLQGKMSKVANLSQSTLRARRKIERFLSGFLFDEDQSPPQGIEPTDSSVAGLGGFGREQRGSMSNIATMPSNIATLAMLLLRSKLLSEQGLERSERVTLSHCHIAT